MTNALRNFLQSASNEIAGGVSAPVDGLAWLLRKAGVPVPQNALMGADWMAEKGLTAPVKPGVGQLAGETFGLLGPMGVAAKATQIARGLLKGGENLAAAGTVNRGGAAAQRGIFMGDQSKTWNKAAAERAAALEKSGADPRAIWQETGTFKGPDGAWRQEIDDSASRVIDNKAAQEFLAGPGPAEYPVGPVGGLLDHPAMNAAYPDAMQIKARLRKGEGGSYVPNTGFGEGFDLPATGTHSTTLHELQHAVQGREGFARGGSPAEIGSARDPIWEGLINKKLEPLFTADDAIRKRGSELSAMLKANKEAIEAYPGYAAATSSGDMKTMQKAVDAAGVPVNVDEFFGLRARGASLLEQAQEIKRRAAFGPDQLERQDIYKRLAGEAEARAVQTRMPMNALQRRQTFPLDSYDVPLDQLIVRR